MTESEVERSRKPGGEPAPSLRPSRPDPATVPPEPQSDEGRYRAIVDSAIDLAVIALDRDGTVTDWNRGAERILGWPAAEICGRGAEAIFTPEDRAAGTLGAAMRRALAEGRSGEERRYLRKDGSLLSASCEMMPLRDEAGEHLGFVKLLRDETGRHRAEAALREAEGDVRRAQEAGGVGLFWIGIEDGVLRATPEFCRLFGLGERDSYHSSVIEALVVPEDAPRTSTAGSRRQGTARGDAEYRIRRADDGAVRWIHRRAEFEPGPDGRPTRFVGAVRDITEQVRAREASRAVQERLGQMWQQAPGFMAMLRTAAHVFEFVNPAYQRLVGDRPVLGRTVADALPDAVEQGYLALLDRVFETGEPYSSSGARFVAQPSSGAPVEEHYVDFVFQPIRDAGGEVSGIFLQGYDVTERVRAERALRASEARYRTLFESLDVGFCIIEVIFDEAGTPADYVFIESNPAFERQAGFKPAPRQRMREISPGHEQIWFDTYGTVALGGEPAYFDSSSRELGRWWQVHAFRVGDPAARRVGVLFTDVSARKGAETRQTALLALGDQLRDLTDPAEIAFAGCRILAEALGVSRVGYGRIDPVAETITIDRDWNAPGVASIAGVLRFRDYGSYIDDLKRGETVAVQDAEQDPRTSPTAAALRGIGAQAFVNMPLLEQGRFVALLFANNATPYGWSEDALLLMREVAERVRDATERARSATALRESEEQFRVFAEAMPNQVWAARPDGHLYWFNQQVYAYTGEGSGALDGPTEWGRLIHPDDLAGSAETWAGALGTGRVYETEFRIRREDGTYRWFLVRAEPVRAADGTVARWVGTNTDIDDRRRQAAELAFLNANLEQQVAERTAERDRIWRLSTDVMLVARFDATIVAVNPAWTALLGWREDELIGRSFKDLVHPDDLAPTLGAVGGLSEGASIPRFENRYRARDGSYRWLSWTAVPDDRFIHAVGRDVQAEKEAAETLRRTEEALRQSQKMEAVGQLTGGIAHDFNNLLTGITGSLELLSARIAQGRLGEVERYTTAAQGAARRAASLTHRLLAFSRRQTLDPKPTDVNRLVAGMEDLVRRTVGPSIELEVVAAVGLWPTLVDPSQLENALLNLCINARDAMPDGGRITIETANRWVDRRGAAERDLSPGQYISMCVSDTGTGMSPEVVAKAFEPFFTTKPLGVGTGLGLSMIYGFARQSGGQVRIYSEPGQGAMICLYLPRHTGEAEPIEPDAGLADAPRAGAGETVLVVDDEPTVRMLVTEVLEELGYGAIEAADGPSGLAILQSDVRIDLLVTDVGLPGGMNGRQMADAARVARPDLKVLFVTGYAENAVVGNGHLDPGMHILTKPFAMDALAARIRDLIAA